MRFPFCGYWLRKQNMQLPTIKLGGRRGSLSDWMTQKWVQWTGRQVTWKDHPWLEAPVGDIDVIGSDFFVRYANRKGLKIIDQGKSRGILDNFADLSGPNCRPYDVNDEIVDFYEKTSDYDFDVWSEWSGVFKPFGKLLAVIFSRRLEQLNIPLSSLETRLGITSDVLKLTARNGQSLYSAWIRKTVSTGRTLYVGSYQTCLVPGFPGPCIKVAFPLPNGYALVIMKPESQADGSFVVRSTGTKFGDPGFYFFVEGGPGRGWARYVASLKESIAVYRDQSLVLRADHELHLWGREFLRLHYRIASKKPQASNADSPTGENEAKSPDKQ